jgi:S1-C subfamily serine protease
MKGCRSLRYFSILTLLCCNDLIAQTHRESANSVVKINSTFLRVTNGKTESLTKTATGWCWYDGMHIVTALHAVAAVRDITVSTNSLTVHADVESVYLEADLALLRLRSTLNLKPLTTEAVDPNSDKQYWIYGYPHAVYEMQGNRIDFSLSQPGVVPTLNSILAGTSTAIKTQLTSQGYPLPEVKILRIGSTIQPGQSGAPIFSPQGKVIGIADGGLYGGTASINWAMPADVYVRKLLTSRDRKPEAPAFQSNLMSTTVVDLNATAEEQKKKIIAEGIKNTVVNGNRSILKTRTASYDVLLMMMAKEDREPIEESVKDNGVSMKGQFFDIYEDFKTGASIAMPFGESFKVSKDWFESSNREGTIRYSVCPWTAKSFADAKRVARVVMENSHPSNLWKISDEPDDSTIDNTEKTAYYQFDRISIDNKRSVLYYAAVDGLNVLITEIVYEQNRIDDDEEYEKKFARYFTAMNLAVIGNKEEVKAVNTQSVLAEYSVSGFMKKQTVTYYDMLARMINSDIEAYNKRIEDHKVDMRDVKFNIYKDIKTGLEFLAPAGEKLSIYNKVWLNIKNEENTIFCAAHPYASNSFEEAKNRAANIFIRNFPEDRWTLQKTTSTLVIDENKNTVVYNYNLKSTDGLTGYYKAMVSGLTAFVTYFRFDEKKFTDPEYYKRYVQYRIAVNRPRFGKPE